MSNTEKKLSKEVKPTSTTFKKVIRKATEEESVNFRVEEPKVRYLKLQPFFRRTTYSSKTVPELRLRGNWLEQAGFSLDNYVSVTVMNGLLIIRSTETEDRNVMNDE
jgi:hypothetical protein